MGQKVSLQTFDLQLYGPSKEILWRNPVEFNNYFVHLGGFHGEICYLFSLGNIWGSAGLKDMLVYSDVYAEGTVDMIFQGKEFNRGIRAFILAYETLSQLSYDLKDSLSGFEKPNMSSLSLCGTS